MKSIISSYSALYARICTRRLACVMLCALSFLYARAFDSLHECEVNRDTFNARHPDKPWPSHFCACDQGVQYGNGLDTILFAQDTAWFYTTLGSVKQGMTCYWFSDSPVSIGLFLSCAQDSTEEIPVSGNTSYELDRAKVESMLSMLGSMDGAETMEMSLRCYLTRPGSRGRVVSSPYDVGPKSTCEAPLPFYAGMTYVLSDQEAVYEYTPKYRVSEPVALHWKSKKNSQAEVWITRDSCNGDEVLRLTMQDSTRVKVLPAAFVNELVEEGGTLMIHVSTTGVGRFRMISQLHTKDLLVEEQYCQGKTRQVADSIYSVSYRAGDTVRITVMDSVWRYKMIPKEGPVSFFQNPNIDSSYLEVTRYELTYFPPVVEDTTINCYVDKLGFNFAGDQNKKVNAYGDYHFVVERPNQCTHVYDLHVSKLWRTASKQDKRETCLGKTIWVNGEEFDSDTTFMKVDTTAAYPKWPGELSTITTTTYSLRFTEPEERVDSIACLRDTFPFDYGYDPENVERVGVIEDFGEYTFTIEDWDRCTEFVRLFVRDAYVAPQDTLPQDTLHIDTTRIDTLPNLPIDSLRNDSDTIDNALHGVAGAGVHARLVWQGGRWWIRRGDELYSLLGQRREVADDPRRKQKQIK